MSPLLKNYLREHRDQHRQHLVDFRPPLLQRPFPFLDGVLLEPGDVGGYGLQPVAGGLGGAVQLVPAKRVVCGAVSRTKGLVGEPFREEGLGGLVLDALHRHLEVGALYGDGQKGGSQGVVQEEHWDYVSHFHLPCGIIVTREINDIKI